MTEREIVVRILAPRDLSRFPSVQALANHLREREGGTWHGGSGWLPHVPRENATFMDPDTRLVRANWMCPEHRYEFACFARGVFIGPEAHVRGCTKEPPDLTWPDLARIILGQQRPQQLTLWSMEAAA